MCSVVLVREAADVCNELEHFAELEQPRAAPA